MPSEPCSATLMTSGDGSSMRRTLQGTDWYNVHMEKRGKKQVNRAAGVIAYSRVSTEEQVQTGLSLEAQKAQILSESKRRGMPLLAIYEDAGLSGKDLSRPALKAALSDMEAGLGSVLMVSRLDRLTRSVHDATGLMEKAQKGGWGLVALDAPVDTTSPAGAAMTQVMSVFAELERKLIGERTKSALAIKRAQGIRLGRPRQLTPEVVERIVSDRGDGMGWSAIARSLNEEGVPTAQGGKAWYPATVQKVALAAEAALSRPRTLGLTMRYRRYETSSDLPGSRTVIRTGPISSVWFGAQGIVLTVIIFTWPSLTLAINYHRWWAWLVFPPVQILWLVVLRREVKSPRRRSFR